MEKSVLTCCHGGQPVLTDLDQTARRMYNALARLRGDPEIGEYAFAALAPELKEQFRAMAKETGDHGSFHISTTQ